MIICSTCIQYRYDFKNRSPLGSINKKSSPSNRKAPVIILLDFTLILQCLHRLQTQHCVSPFRTQ